MEYTKKHKKKWNNKNRKDGFNNKDKNGQKEDIFIAENSEEIKLHKQNTKTCEYCSKPIHEISSALIDKKSGGAIHFDCVISKLSETEKLEQGQKITYIGQGRFAVLFFENPHDLRKFTIVRTIEWEDQDTQAEWRSKIAGLYSQVK